MSLNLSCCLIYCQNWIISIYNTLNWIILKKNHESCDTNVIKSRYKIMSTYFPGESEVQTDISSDCYTWQTDRLTDISRIPGFTSVFVMYCKFVKWFGWLKLSVNCDQLHSISCNIWHSFGTALTAYQSPNHFTSHFSIFLN